MHVDGVTVDELPDYLRAHWPVIREHLLAGRTFCGWRVAEASGERTEVTRSHLKFPGIGWSRRKASVATSSAMNARPRPGI